ncbi:MAG: thioredoxin domain-containing protein [Myxococcota bacterium]|nr:thioredoxin domain-containing protein [Myxococcota bacterium]
MKLATILLALLFIVSACSKDLGESVTSHRLSSKTDVSGVSAVNPSKDKPRMIALHASYCSACTRMKPLVQQIAAECGEKGVLVDVIDVAEQRNEKYLGMYRVAGLPTYVFVDEKHEETARLVGAQPESTLRQALSVLTNEVCPGVGSLPTGYRPQEERQTSCRFTNSDATAAKSSSKLSNVPKIVRKSLAPNANDRQGSCSQVSL